MALEISIKFGFASSLGDAISSVCYALSICCICIGCLFIFLTVGVPCRGYTWISGEMEF